jgi:hypothetical protein
VTYRQNILLPVLFLVANKLLANLACTLELSEPYTTTYMLSVLISNKLAIKDKP